MDRRKALNQPQSKFHSVLRGELEVKPLRIWNPY
jgi:hypothetical protein